MDIAKLSSAANRLLVAALEWCLRLFTVPCELLIRNQMGERYVGASGALGLLFLWVWTLWSAGSGLLYLLLTACLIQIVVIRVKSIRSRASGTPTHTRSAGRPLLSEVIPLPPSVVFWIEPFALLAAGLVLGLLSPSMGEYLLAASLALLLLAILRWMSAYYRNLDAIDEQIELKLPMAQVIDLPSAENSRQFTHEPLEPILDIHFPPHRIPASFVPTMTVDTEADLFSSDH